MKKKTEEERKKEVERIAKHMHPHDDEPDPTAYMGNYNFCLLYTSPSPRDATLSRMPSSA